MVRWVTQRNGYHPPAVAGPPPGAAPLRPLCLQVLRRPPPLRRHPHKPPLPGTAAPGGVLAQGQTRQIHQTVHWVRLGTRLLRGHLLDRSGTAATGHLLDRSGTAATGPLLDRPGTAATGPLLTVSCTTVTGPLLALEGTAATGLVYTIPEGSSPDFHEKDDVYMT